MDARQYTELVNANYTGDQWEDWLSRHRGSNLGVAATNEQFNLPESDVFHSYSGCDILVVVVLPVDGRWQAFQTEFRKSLEEEIERLSAARTEVDGGLTDTQNLLKFRRYQRDHLPSGVMVLGNVSTLSYSVFREKFPVRALGVAQAKAYTRGTRTIAGSLVFTVFDSGALQDLASIYYEDSPEGFSIFRDSAVLADQFPPFNIIVLFQNEYGSSSRLVLSGVELFNEGMTLSVNDLMTENTFEYVARSIEPMRSKKSLDASIGRDPGKFGSPMTLDYVLRGSKDLQKLSTDILKQAMNPYI